MPIAAQWTFMKILQIHSAIFEEEECGFRIPITEWVGLYMVFEFDYSK